MIIVDVDEDADAKPPFQVVEDSDAAATTATATGAQLDGHLGSVVQPQSPQTDTPSWNSYLHSYHTAPLLPPPPPPSYPKRPSYPAPSTSAVPHHHRRTQPAKRFWKAFAVALLVYLALLSLTRTIIHMATAHTHWGDGSVGVPRAEDGRVLESIGSLNWTTYQHRPRWAPSFSESAETSFLLPVSSDTLYLITRGSSQGGHVEVRQSREQGTDVRVDVRVAYHDERALARATVCRLRRSENKHGVGIYTPMPSWSHARDQLYFEVVLTFPGVPPERSPLRINRLTTDTANFAHQLGDLWESLLFENLELGTSNSPIQANSVTLTRGTLTSSNGAISGHFNTSDTLILRTSNARIQVTASLYSTGAGPTKLDMRTSNGVITSSVSLATPSGSGGNFFITSRSSNGGLKLQYDDAPNGARLISEAQTSNSVVEVTMHPAFEGTYEVSTSNSRPVVRDTHPVDPAGRGRRRVVNQTTSRGTTLAGRVYWTGGDGTRRAEGVSTVRTSNGRASLDL